MGETLDVVVIEAVIAVTEEGGEIWFVRVAVDADAAWF